MEQEITITIESEEEIKKMVIDDFLQQQAAYKQEMQQRHEPASHLITPDDKTPILLKTEA